MPTLIFPNIPFLRKSLNVQNTYRVKKSQFGGNFKQVKPQSTNPIDTKVDLEFIVGLDDFNTLMNFFDQTAGANPFVWQLPTRLPSYWLNGPVSWTPERDDLIRVKTFFQEHNQYAPLTNLIEIEPGVGLAIN